MTVQTETTLKGYFNDGDQPDESALAAFVESAKRPYVRLVTATPDTVDAADDQVLIIDTAAIAGAVAVNLPAGANNQRILIKDKGSAGTYNITVNRNGTDTFESAATSLTINTNFGWVELIFLSGIWYTINEGS